MAISFGCLSVFTSRKSRRMSIPIILRTSTSTFRDTTTEGDPLERHERFALSSHTSDSTPALSIIAEEDKDGVAPPTSTPTGSRQVSSSDATSTTCRRDISNVPYAVGASEIFESRMWHERSETSFASDVSTAVLEEQLMGVSLSQLPTPEALVHPSSQDTDMTVSSRCVAPSVAPPPSTHTVSSSASL
ncbi:hypothetical protein BCR37DRAFT_316155 [Protomyces lactucae-debilis]|uniref:Uncharacterized protein n=1 Tax=Protomyces lactucae-debilis TaxID=2754530 RepID=A0A1Y2FF42_PROLT|nr:uncharacterized protein BCR37DRAFT_316155 [Protomyces lactucae-debilis]ORY82580.1 hypothetical protein BCR37DRAFT_316155 [Protomyces lactucae-debilis]